MLKAEDYIGLRVL